LDEVGRVHDYKEIFYTVSAAKNAGAAAIFDMSW
jgi:hypothetical protein